MTLQNCIVTVQKLYNMLTIVGYPTFNLARSRKPVQLSEHAPASGNFQGGDNTAIISQSANINS